MKKLLIALLVTPFGITYGGTAPQGSVYQASNQQFRDEVVSYIKQQLQKSNEIKETFLIDIDAKFKNTYQRSDWTTAIDCYQNGKKIGRGVSHNKNLNLALYNGLDALRSEVRSPENCTFKVDFSYYPNRHFTFITYKNQGLEVAGNRVILRRLTLAEVKDQVKDSLGYLTRVMHPGMHGFYKFYDASSDNAEKKLRTIYSASSLFTFIKAQAAFPSLELHKHFKPIAQFILSQQLLSGKNRGAFYYSYDPLNKTPEKRLVVGTASKTIFTLLLLHELYPEDPTYLKAAKLAGDWLIKQILDDARIIAVQTFEGDRWVENTHQSLLYSGQVLSALSRLYSVTHDTRYLTKATLIANDFLDKIQQQGSFLGDDYRPANSISSSWVLLSLIDIAKVKPLPKYIAAIERIATTLRQGQITDLNDIYYAGKFSDATTTSGNGWLNEVFGEYYPFCLKMKMQHCEPYKNAMILSSRWLMQNAYRENNRYNIKNPQFAKGGFVLNYHNQMVRTDAVCHGVNSLLSLLNIIGNQKQPLIDIKAQPLFKILPLIRAGNAVG